MTITRTGDMIGQAMTFGTAWVATITQDDFRLWAVAIVGLSISITCNLPRIRQRRYEAQEAREKLCANCLKYETHSQNCVVETKHRPLKCPLGKDNK